MKQSNTIIVGAGRLGRAIARKINKVSNVLVVDKSKDKLNRLQDYSGFVDCGDATDLSFLEKSGIKAADKIVAVTDDDNVNIFLADVCTYIYDVPHIVIKLKDSRKRVLVDDRVKCICLFDLCLDNYEKASEGEVGR